MVFSLKPMGSDSFMAKIRLTESGIILHLIGYFLLTLIGYWSYANDKLNPLMHIIMINITLGLCLEFVQYLLPYRSFNILDIYGNLIGIGLALFFILMMMKWGWVKKSHFLKWL